MNVTGDVQLTGSNALNHETRSVTTSSVGLAAIPAGAKKAVITTETSDIRYWVDGTAPTNTNGHLIKAGGSFELDSAGQITNFRAIAVSGTSALQVTYF